MGLKSLKIQLKLLLQKPSYRFRVAPFANSIEEVGADGAENESYEHPRYLAVKNLVHRFLSVFRPSSRKGRRDLCNGSGCRV
jgi:hypothetical protein